MIPRKHVQHPDDPHGLSDSCSQIRRGTAVYTIVIMLRSRQVFSDAAAFRLLILRRSNPPAVSVDAAVVLPPREQDGSLIPEALAQR